MMAPLLKDIEENRIIAVDEDSSGAEEVGENFPMDGSSEDSLGPIYNNPPASPAGEALSG